MNRIVFLERDTFRIEFRRPEFDHEWIDYPTTESRQVIERLQDATIAIVNKLQLRAPALTQLPNLKLIAVAATGVDNIDLEYCRQHQIAVTNVRNYAGNSVPEHVLMLMLTLRRHLLNFRDDVRSGKWEKAQQFCLLDHPIHDLFGSALGIIGYGFLGQSVARLAKSVGMEVLVAERKHADVVRAGRVSFRDVLSRSDVISLHCPLTESTLNLITQAELRQMKPHALLINTARGGLVNEADLIHALETKQIAGAAFDVLTTEPPRDGNILLSANLPNLIVTPHIAWASREAMQTLGNQLIDNIEAFVRGERQNRVD